MSVIDLNGLKEQMQTVLQAQNTTTASILDLSNGLTTRITKVFKKHPRHLIGQASEFPCVTIFIDGKGIDNTTIQVNQRSAKRKAEVRVRVAGMLWDNNFASNDDDEAEDDIEALMENIEEIFRNDYTLGNTVHWVVPEDVEYFSLYGEESHLVTGVLSMKAVKFY